MVNFEPGSSSMTAINANHNIMPDYDLHFLEYNYLFLNLTFSILTLQKVCLFVDFYHDNNTFLLLTVEIWGWGPIYCSLPPQWGILFSFVYINLGKELAWRSLFIQNSLILLGLGLDLVLLASLKNIEWGPQFAEV